MTLNEQFDRDGLSHLFAQCKDFKNPFNLDFETWLFFENEHTECLECVLRCAQMARANIWDTKYNCAINDALFLGRRKHIKSLLKFGIKHRFHLIDIEDLMDLEYSDIKFEVENLGPSVERSGKFLTVKGTLLLQVLHVYLLQFSSIEDFVDGTEGLISIWRSIPNLFLSKEEILSVLKPTSAFYPHLPHVYSYYLKDVVLKVEPFFDNSRHRTLAHMCRGLIRERLVERFALPGAISRLGLTIRSEKYLQLES